MTRIIERDQKQYANIYTHIREQIIKRESKYRGNCACQRRGGVWVREGFWGWPT